MNNLHVMLISAGIARRMYPLTRETPKCLLKLTDKLTILDIQMRELAKLAPEKIHIIVGFKADMIQAHIQKNYSQLPVEFIFNPFFEVSNNLASLWLGLKSLDTELITINGDNIFDVEVIRELAASKGDIVVSLAQKDTYDDDDMKVRLHEDVLTDIGKDINPNHTDAESLGIIKYTVSGLRMFKEILDNLIENDRSAINMFYLSAIDKIAKESDVVKSIIVEQSQWFEFDFSEDLEAVARSIKEKSAKISSLY